jgi:hypothetical protein
MFHIGQKVVCVDDTGLVREPHPHKGNIYVISRIGQFGCDLHVDVMEITKWPVPLGWKAWRFRPLVERKRRVKSFR